MSYVAIVQDLPRDLQLPMLKLVEAVQLDLRAELAVRRSDFDRLDTAVTKLTQAQNRTEQRSDRLETALYELAQAQKRTEDRASRNWRRRRSAPKSASRNWRRRRSAPNWKSSN
ncbi:MAG: hypothetical protein V9H69_16500 [Anaerolineae bacterium]